ncbi:MAG: 5'-methylthioadenosine/adenosylhomocysteine nucleosidase, partial [Spirochaeta sp.]|nr:5'-methylthioadenosine/adenosylhomocysteine nucleosidase [Spirochaeta sp.]
MNAIIAAMDGEIAAVRQQMEHVSEWPGVGGPVAVGTLFGKPVVLARSGVGKVMAAICTQQMISNY